VMDIITEKTEDERKYLMDVEKKVQLLTLEDMDKKQHEEITDESYLLNVDKIFLHSLNVYFSQD
jgi:hypothetical protein